MRKTMIVAAALAALAGQGCTVVGITLGAVKASGAKAERDARIDAGFVDEAPISMTSSVIGSGLVGAMIDVVLLGALAASGSGLGNLGSD